jgi:molybdopterin-synthase adenylyltransferase
MTGWEVTDEAPEAGYAGNASLLESEGGLSNRGGRSSEPGGRPPFASRRWRLKRSVDLFEADNGSIYLLRDGAGDDFVVEQAASWERAMLRGLRDGFVSEGDLGSIPDCQVDQSLAQLRRARLVEECPRDDRLSPRERERYDRQLIYLADLAGDDASAEELQQRLLRSHVLLVGCGGLGCWTAAGLVGAGVGALTLVDDDVVALSNLNRQILFAESDIGRPKVEVAAAALKRQNRDLDLRLDPHRVGCVEDIARLLCGVDLLIATADWPPHELPRWVNQACLVAGVPHITAGQFPPRLRVGPLVLPHQTSCLECQERQARKAFPLYDEIAEHRARNPATAATIGAVSGIVGSMLAMEAIHLLTGAIRPASVDTALILDLKTMSFSAEKIARDSCCPACA